MFHKILAAAALLLLAGCAAKAPPAPPGSVPIPTAPPQRPEPPGFSGLAADALTARLGAPAFSRKDGPTEMWRYDNGDCRAFFFLQGGKVTHVETTPRPANAAADTACLNGLKKAS